MTKYRIVYWRDIPVQVRVHEGGERQSYPLSPRFQKTVYRAAYRGKAITGEAYLREWRPSEWYERGEPANVVLTLVTSELEHAYSDERLNRLALNKGYESNDD